MKAVLDVKDNSLELLYAMQFSGPGFGQQQQQQQQQQQASSSGSTSAKGGKGAVEVMEKMLKVSIVYFDARTHGIVMFCAELMQCMQ